MQTITIEILNNKALKILKDLEWLQLIKLSDLTNSENIVSKDWSKYKGAMTKQSSNEIDKQLNDLRNEWE